MPAIPPRPRIRLRELLARCRFWLVFALLAIIACFHYAPQTRPQPTTLFGTPSHLTRHAVERVLLVTPIVLAALTFGTAGGVLTSVLAVLIMLPRILFLSSYSVDAFFEMAAVFLVGMLVSWLVGIEKREKRLRQKVIAELEAINTISALTTRSLDLEQILGAGLDKVLQVIDLQPRAGIFLLDAERRELCLAAHRGLSEEFVRQERVVPLGECLCGHAAQSGKILFSEEGTEDARHTRMREMGPHAHMIVPLKSRDKVLGVMLLYPRKACEPRSWCLRLLTSIGNQIGVAIENAQLFERERRARELCQTAREHSRYYARNITRAQEDERKRIARELHDDTAQALLLLSRRIDALSTTARGLPERVAQGLDELSALTRSILRGVRNFSRDLRPPVLDDLGLVPALESVMAGLLKTGGTQAELKVIGDRRRLSPDTELALFRIAQEALRNVRKHAQASMAIVRVEFERTRIRIMVRDDGKGFEQPEMLGTLAQMGKMGLVGMQERAELIGGTLSVRSRLGEGTVVVAEVPAEGR